MLRTHAQGASDIKIRDATYGPIRGNLYTTHLYTGPSG